MQLHHDAGGGRREQQGGVGRERREDQRPCVSRVRQVQRQRHGRGGQAHAQHVERHRATLRGRHVVGRDRAEAGDEARAQQQLQQVREAGE